LESILLPGFPCSIIFSIPLFFYLAALFAAIVSPVSHTTRPEALFANEILLFRALKLPTLDTTELTIIIYVWYLALFFSAIGCVTKISCILAFLLGLYIGGSRQNFGIAFHEESTLVMGLLIMAFASFPPHFSLGGLLEKNWGSKKFILLAETNFSGRSGLREFFSYISSSRQPC